MRGTLNEPLSSINNNKHKNELSIKYQSFNWLMINVMTKVMIFAMIVATVYRLL